jgi:NADH:ubiquinone oxidoreductase subunit 3 (subunit A)
MATVIILLVIVVIVAGLVWMMRGKSSPTRRRTTQLDKYEAMEPAGASLGGVDKLKSNPMFWGLEMGQPGCEAAMKILGQQYPFDDVPQLPLPGCDSAMCTCQFKGLTNRRSQQRRKTEDRRKEVRFESGKSPDRRSRKDRRRGDKWNDHTL